jgi:hypothetical protein
MRSQRTLVDSLSAVQGILPSTHIRVHDHLLEQGTAKNVGERVVYLTSELPALLAAPVERVRAVECEIG